MDNHSNNRLPARRRLGLASVFLLAFLIGCFWASRDFSSQSTSMQDESSGMLVSGNTGSVDAQLHFAASAGQIAKMKMLLAQHAEVNAKDNSSWPPQQPANSEGNPNAGSVLLAHEGSASAMNRFSGRTALHMASSTGHADAAALLLAHGADVNAQDDAGDTPLHAAENADVVQTLLAHGADINVRDKRGLSPLDTAMESNHQDVIACLICRGAKINPRYENVNGLLMKMIEYGNGNSNAALESTRVNTVRVLLARGADVNAKVPGEKNESLLQHLLRIGDLQIDPGNVKIAGLLLAHGADASTGMRNVILLMNALDDGNTGAAARLVAHGADVNARDGEGKTALIREASALTPGAVAFLLAHGANVNAKGDDGYTALTYPRNTQIANLLIAHGAEINAKDPQGHTPLYWAEQYHNGDVAALLRQHGGHE